MTLRQLESPFELSGEASSSDLFGISELEREHDDADLGELEFDFSPEEMLFEDEAELRAPESESDAFDSWVDHELPAVVGSSSVGGRSLDDFVAVALSQRGDPYVFGAEANVNDPNPPAFDCSELVEWASARVGVRFVDGAQSQRDGCQRAGTLIPVEEGLRTRGALLFRIDEGPGNDHVAISLGDGTTMEAKGTSYGVNVFSAANRRWTHAGIVPGFAYKGGGSAPPPAPVPVGSRTLRPGSRGEDVRALQRTLQMRGFDPGPADGIFGSRTESSVRAFQKAFGLQVDGVVGPITWGALLGKGSGTPRPATAPAATGAMQVIELGELVLEASGRPRFAYRFTPEDLIWTAKLLVHEAGGEDDAENAAVIWAMFNRYALFTHSVFPNFTGFIRAYSTTLQPELRSAGAAARHYQKGDAVYRRSDGFYKGTQIPKGQLVRHLRIQAAPWSEVKESARSVATRGLRGELPNPGIGLASEFASTHIYFKQRHGREPNDLEFLAYTRELARRKKWEFVGNVPGVNPKKNAFFLDNRAKSLPSDAVRVRPPGQGQREAWSEEEFFSFEPGILSEDEFDELRA